MPSPKKDLEKKAAASLLCHIIKLQEQLLAELRKTKKRTLRPKKLKS